MSLQRFLGEEKKKKKNLPSRNDVNTAKESFPD